MNSSHFTGAIIKKKDCVMKVMVLKPSIAPVNHCHIHCLHNARGDCSCLKEIVLLHFHDLKYTRKHWVHFWYASTFDTIHRYNAFTVYSGFRIQQ